MRTDYIDWMILSNILNELAHSTLFWIVIIVVVLDFLTGTSKAIVTGQVDSSIGTRGLVKHTTIILLVMVISIFSRLSANQYIAPVFKLFYIFEYCVSIIENLDVIGVPFPDELRKYIKRLQDKNNEEWGEKD